MNSEPHGLLPVARPADSGSLSYLIEALHAGPWRFIQLRGAPLSEADIDAGDVDLLGSRESVDRLIQAAFSWVQNGQCHLHVMARTDSKSSFKLISLDGAHTLHFDLWVKLWQIGDPRAYLRFEDCEPLLQGPRTAIQRLPTVVEACLYLHHLAAKRKDLARPGVQRRLEEYSEACATCPDLASALRNLATGNGHKIRRTYAVVSGIPIAALE